MNSNAMDHFQGIVGSWAEEQFPLTTDRLLMDHLSEEIGELKEALGAPDEAAIRDNLADCLILLCSIGYRHGISLLTAAREKQSINYQRQWRFDPDCGYERHIDPIALAQPGEAEDAREVERGETT